MIFRSFIEGITFIGITLVCICFALIPEAVGYGLYNLIDPVTEIGRILSILGLTVITIPFAIWFVPIGLVLWIFLLEAFL